MLEYTEKNRYSRGEYFYTGYCDGLLSSEAETVVRIGREVSRNAESFNKFRDTMTDEFLVYLEDFVRVHTEQTTDHAARNLLKESEFLPSYLAYSYAKDIRDYMKSVSFESEGAEIVSP